MNQPYQPRYIRASSLAADRRAKEAKAKKRKAKAKRKKARRAASCVYVIRMGPFIKVGFTRSSVADRVASLQTGSPLPLEVLGTFKHPQPHRLEAFVHSLLHDHRAAGEWFTCSLADVERVVEVASVLKPAATWDDWRALAAANGGAVLAATWEERAEHNAAALRAAQERQRELEDVLADWLNAENENTP